MAYPDSGINTLLNGTTYDMIRNYLAELGIVYARTAGNDNTYFLLPNDWYAWMPTTHHRNPKILNIIDEFINIDYTKINLCQKMTLFGVIPTFRFPVVLPKTTSFAPR